MATKHLPKFHGINVTISNPDKVLFPAAGFTKAQVLDYYHGVASVLLPHLKGRPITMKRFPDGVSGQSFYEKDAPSFTPDWVKTFPVPRKDKALDPIRYILVNDVRTLLWVANLASLELHPFLHRAPEISRPTHCLFDLDPGEGVDVLACAEVAFILRELLTKLNLKAFPNVSGSKGIQIYVPLNAPVTYDAAQPFTQAVAEMLARQHPDRIVSEMAKHLRKRKVFIDWSQNSDHKTTVSPYSLRAKRELPFVSMPMTWEELRGALRKGKPDALYWEAPKALKRVAKVGDLFAPVLKIRQRLPEEFKRDVLQASDGD